jgi:hypothetical protein
MGLQVSPGLERMWDRGLTPRFLALVRKHRAALNDEAD